MGALQVSLDRLQLHIEQAAAAAAGPSQGLSRDPMVAPPSGSTPPSAPCASASDRMQPNQAPQPHQAARAAAAGAGTSTVACEGLLVDGSGSGSAVPGGSGVAPGGAGAGASQPDGQAEALRRDARSELAPTKLSDDVRATASGVPGGEVEASGAGGAHAAPRDDDQEELRRRRLERFGYNQDSAE